METPSGEEMLASMPRKFRNHVYICTNSFVVTEPIKEGKKVKAEIIRILQINQIKYFQEQNVWPKSFDIESRLDK